MRTHAPRRVVRAGFERLAAAAEMPRHQHAEAYATILLDGAYEQFAYAGRLRMQAGDILIQPTLDCHADRMLSAGLQLIRLPWRAEASLGGIFRDRRIDDIRRAAEADIPLAVALLEDELRRAPRLAASAEDWSDQLAIDLSADPRLGIQTWAASQGLTREHVSRGFRARFGVSPAQFRSELSARSAWLRIVGADTPLARVAADLGYADQAHMTRAVRALTGAPPGLWRASHSFKTQAAPSAKLPE